MNAATKSLFLFGGDIGWHAGDWTDSDDRVRGGKSQSYLACTKRHAEFYGSLDTTALGGAGFASQRTSGDDRLWDLSTYAGIELSLAEVDAKRYAFILKDELLPPNPDDGREQSTISYEYEFNAADAVNQDNGLVFIPWKDFKATYRGREKRDAPALDVSQIRRMSVMMRSYFGAQEGDFSLTLNYIAAAAGRSPFAATDSAKREASVTESCITDEPDGKLGQPARDAKQKGGDSLMTWLFGKCLKL